MSQNNHPEFTEEDFQAATKHLRNSWRALVYAKAGFPKRAEEAANSSIKNESYTENLLAILQRFDRNDVPYDSEEAKRSLLGSKIHHLDTSLDRLKSLDDKLAKQDFGEQERTQYFRRRYCEEKKHIAPYKVFEFIFGMRSHPYELFGEFLGIPRKEVVMTYVDAFLEKPRDVQRSHQGFYDFWEEFGKFLTREEFTYEECEELVRKSIGKLDPWDSYRLSDTISETHTLPLSLAKEIYARFVNDGRCNCDPKLVEPYQDDPEIDQLRRKAYLNMVSVPRQRDFEELVKYGISEFGFDPQEGLFAERIRGSVTDAMGENDPFPGYVTIGLRYGIIGQEDVDRLEHRKTLREFVEESVKIR